MNARHGVVASSLTVALLLSGSAHAQISPTASASLRIGTETLLGGLGTIAGGLGGLYFALSTACRTDPGDSPTMFGCSAFMPIAIGIVVPVAVWGAGALWGGQGGFLPTLLGSTVGAASSMVLLYLTNAAVLDQWWSSALTLLLPMLGGIIGYEVSNSLALRQAGAPAPPLAPIRFGFSWSL